MDKNLRALLDAHAAGDTEKFDASLAEIDDLTELQAQIITEAEPLRSQEAYSEEDVLALGVLADVHDKVAENIRERTEAQAAIAEKVSGFAQRLTPTTEPGPAEPDGGEEEPAPVPAEPAKRGEPAGVMSTKADPGAVISRLSATSKAASRMSVPQRVHLVAAPDVPGTISGSEYADWDQMADAAIRRWGAMKGAQTTPGPNLRSGLAVLRKNFTPDLVASSDDVSSLVDYAANERRLPGGSLVAAGGWCAPSETLYEVCELESRDGMLDVPEIQASRGGVRHSPGPSFATIYANVGFTQTEAEAIANTAKGCFEIDCPTFTDVRLSIFGVCLTAGILQDAAYPEFIARYLRGALIVHAHKVNAAKIAAITAGSTAVTYAAVATITPQGATSGLLETVEMQVEDMRHRQRLSMNDTLEVVLPSWTRGVIRADLSKRTGVDLLGVTDAMITQWFAIRGAAVQWVYDYQDAFVQAGTGMGGATPATAWPATVRFLIFPAGTWVAATRDVITLDAGIYDTTSINTNKFNALFTEEGVAMLKRCADSRTVTVPICPSGATAVAIDMDCTP